MASSISNEISNLEKRGEKFIEPNTFFGFRLIFDNINLDITHIKQIPDVSCVYTNPNEIIFLFDSTETAQNLFECLCQLLKIVPYSPTQIIHFYSNSSSEISMYLVWRCFDYSQIFLRGLTNTTENLTHKEFMEKCQNLNIDYESFPNEKKYGKLVKYRNNRIKIFKEPIVCRNLPKISKFIFS